MKEQEWKRLWNEAWVAYQDFVAAANDTFQLLSNIKFPVSIEMREQILLQRRVENEARERMQMGRNILIDKLTHSETHPAKLVEFRRTGRE
jgi:hypothetical protein